MSELPSEREKLRVISAIPAKDILKNKSRVCPPLSAICEIMDNIFDNFEENGSKRDLAISFLINTTGAGEISIAENSGGIPARLAEFTCTAMAECLHVRCALQPLAMETVEARYSVTILRVGAFTHILFLKLTTQRTYRGRLHYPQPKK